MDDNRAGRVCFGGLIRELREESGYSPVDLSNTIGMPETYIAEVEAGEKGSIPEETFAALAGALGSRVQELEDLARERCGWTPERA